MLFIASNMTPIAMLTIVLLAFALIPAHCMTPLSFANGTSNSSTPSLSLPNATATDSPLFNVSSTDFSAPTNISLNASSLLLNDTDMQMNISSTDNATTGATAIANATASAVTASVTANATANMTLAEVNVSAIANAMTHLNVTSASTAPFNSTFNATAVDATAANVSTTTLSSTASLDANAFNTTALNDTLTANVSTTFNVSAVDRSTNVSANATSTNITSSFNTITTANDNTTRVLIIGTSWSAQVKQLTDFFYEAAAQQASPFYAVINATIGDLSLTDRLSDADTQSLLGGMYSHIILEARWTGSEAVHAQQISDLLAKRTCNQTTLILVQSVDTDYSEDTDKCEYKAVDEQYEDLKQTLYETMPTPIVVLPLSIPYCQALNAEVPLRLNEHYSISQFQALHNDVLTPTLNFEYLYAAMAFALTTSYSPFGAPLTNFVRQNDRRRLLGVMDPQPSQLTDMQRWAVEALNAHWELNAAEKLTLKHVFGGETDQQDRERKRETKTPIFPPQNKPPSTITPPSITHPQPDAANVPVNVNANSNAAGASEVLNGDPTSASLWLLLTAAVVCLTVYGVMWMRSKSRQAWLRERRGYDDRELSQFEVTKQSTKAYDDDGL